MIYLTLVRPVTDGPNYMGPSVTGLTNVPVQANTAANFCSQHLIPTPYWYNPSPSPPLHHPTIH